MFGGETTFKLGYASIDDAQVEREDEYAVEDEELEARITDSAITDNELEAAIEHRSSSATWSWSSASSTRARIATPTSGIETDTIENVAAFRLARALMSSEGLRGGRRRRQHHRGDPPRPVRHAVGRERPAEVEAGLRYEDHRRSPSTTGPSPPPTARTRSDYEILLPSAGLRWSLLGQRPDHRLGGRAPSAVPTSTSLAGPAGRRVRRQRLHRQSEPGAGNRLGRGPGLRASSGPARRGRRQRLLSRHHRPDRRSPAPATRPQGRARAPSSCTAENTGDGQVWGSSSTCRRRWTSSAWRTPACSSTTRGWTARSTTTSASAASTARRTTS